MTALIALTGTEKQIAWATQIRAEIFGLAAALAESCARHSPDTAAAAQTELAVLATASNAAWWIENRASPARVTKALRTAIGGEHGDDFLNGVSAGAPSKYALSIEDACGDLDNAYVDGFKYGRSVKK